MADVISKDVDRILVPCDPSLPMDRVYQSALSVAQEAAAGLVLLCVQALPQRAATASYSGLRGLQAKLQRCPVPYKIESMYGSVAECVLQYAHEHEVDLIVMSAAEVAEADKGSAEPFVQRVQDVVQCDTLVV